MGTCFHFVWRFVHCILLTFCTDWKRKTSEMVVKGSRSQREPITQVNNNLPNNTQLVFISNKFLQFLFQ